VDWASRMGKMRNSQSLGPKISSEETAYNLDG
jgi:hypothetical protein